MKNLQELITEIENLSFEVQFTVISSFKIMITALKKSETIAQIIDTLQENRSHAEVIFERIKTLAEDKPETGVMHPHDIKVLVYLFALNMADYPRLTLSAIEEIEETPGFYWAKKYAKHIWESVIKRQTKNISYFVDFAPRISAISFELHTNEKHMKIGISSQNNWSSSKFDTSTHDTETYDEVWHVIG